MTTAAIGAFSSAVLVRLDRAAGTVAWGEVRAAYRIDEHTSSIRRADGRLPASGPAQVWARSQAVGDRNLRIEIVASTWPNYDVVTAGTPADPHLPWTTGRRPR
jgi:hypothetical protein